MSKPKNPLGGCSVREEALALLGECDRLRDSISELSQRFINTMDPSFLDSIREETKKLEAVESEATRLVELALRFDMELTELALMHAQQGGIPN
jgi:hypothetical protein